MENWILDEDFDCIRINGIPFLEQSFKVTEENKKIILLASKSPKLLEMVKKLHSLLEEHQPNWYLLGHHREIEKLIKEATTI